jgi:hypothetical protein
MNQNRKAERLTRPFCCGVSLPKLFTSHIASRRIRSRRDTESHDFQLNSNLTAMEQTLSQMLQSPVFWVGTVLVSLAINLLSTYLWGKFIDRWLSGFSEKRRKRSEKEKALYRKNVEMLSKDPTGLIIEFVRSAIL